MRREISIGELPKNIKSFQMDALHQVAGGSRGGWMRSRLFVCIECLMRRGTIHSDTRIDTMDGTLVCSQCR